MLAWGMVQRIVESVPIVCCAGFSSIGLVKAALETINGENLFGWQGASWSVIYVDIDAHNRNRTIFDTILPRESNSKVSMSYPPVMTQYKTCSLVNGYRNLAMVWFSNRDESLAGFVLDFILQTVRWQNDMQKIP